MRKDEDKQIVSEWMERLTDFTEFAPKFLKIKDEYGNIVHLNFNYAQQKILKVIQDFQIQGLPIRIIVLKARQMGISTLIQGWSFHYEITHSNQKMLTMGHKVDASGNLFEMYKRYYDNLPRVLQPSIQSYSQEKKIIYKKLKSESKTDTAQTGSGSNEEGTGRSDTYQILHLTEVAFYPNARVTLRGLLQSSKYAKAIFIESTANGVGDAFYDMWKDAIDGNTDYIPIFIGWLEFPTYTKPFKDEEEKDKLLVDLGNALFNEYEGEEKMLIGKGATLEQLNWRRWAIKNLCNNSISTFHSEYPTDWQEAFVSTGRPVFPAAVCQKNKITAMEMERKKQKPLYTGDLVLTYDEDIKRELISQGKTTFEDLKYAVEKVEFVESQRGFIKIWIPLKRDGMYRFASGVDTSEGLEQGDRSEIIILDRETDEVAITWSGMIDPDLLAEEIYKLWLFTGKDCHFGIERNNHGLTVINKCFKLGVNLYYKETFNKGYVAQTSSIGWQTNSKTKPFMINELNTWIREALFKNYDSDFWSQCLTFVKNARGQMQAEGKDTDPGSKCYDDKVMAMAIVPIVSTWLPNFYKQKDEDTSVARNIDTSRKAGDYTF